MEKSIRSDDSFEWSDSALQIDEGPTRAARALTPAALYADFDGSD